LQVIDGITEDALHALEVLSKGLHALLARPLIDVQQHIITEQIQTGAAIAFVEGIE
jgi:hypothetical protein